MPDAVRLAHFKKIMSSNFLFGWLVVMILYPGLKNKNAQNIELKGVK